MKQEITQVKFSKQYNERNVSVICTQSTIQSSCWECKFNRTSLLNVADFVVELFNCTTLNNATLLSLHFGEHIISVEKCAENNTFTHYLEELASKLIY